MLRVVRYLIVALATCCTSWTASAAVYLTQASFFERYPGREKAMIGFTGMTSSIAESTVVTRVRTATITAPDPTFVSHNFWGSVDSLLDNTFNGFVEVSLPTTSAIGFLYASGYDNSVPIDLTVWRGTRALYKRTLTGAGVRAGFHFGFFGIDKIGPITGFTLDSANYAGGFASIGEIASAPEPASWVTMIVGFGLVGAALRRRIVAV